MGEKFKFRPKFITTLQLVRLVERVNSNFDERRLTGAVFLRCRTDRRPPLQPFYPKLPVVPGENYILISALPNVSNILLISHTHTS
jgi:hypothetical protein